MNFFVIFLALFIAIANGCASNDSSGARSNKQGNQSTGESTDSGDLADEGDDLEDDDLAMGTGSDKEDAIVADEGSSEREDQESPAGTQAESVVGEQETTNGVTDTSDLTNQLTDLQYLNKSGEIIIKTQRQASYQIRRVDERSQLIIELANTKVPDRLKRPYITKQFGGSLEGITAYQSMGSSSGRVVLQMVPGAGEPVISQESNVLRVSLTGVASQASTGSSVESQEGESPSAKSVTDEDSREPLAPKTLDEFLAGQSRFYGKKISIQFKDAEIADVITFIAEQSGANLLLSEEIKGKINLKLREIPWDQALVVVMRSKGLGYVRQGNIIRIATLETIRKETDEAQKLVDSQRKLEKLMVKIVPLNYTPVADMKKQVEPLLTERGKVTEDTRSASLVIKDISDSIERAVRLIKYLDTPPAQVLIEAKIVEAQETFMNQVGIRWDNSGFKIDLKGGNSAIQSSLSVGSAKVTGEGGLDFSLNVGTLDIFGDFAARLALLENLGQVKLISSPRVVVLNNEKAQIGQTTEMPIIQQTRSSSGDNSITKTVSFKSYKLNLEVTPQITPDGGVMLLVDILREFVGSVADEETQARPLNSRQAHTRALVKDAQTAVLGGIYQSDITTSESRIPWISKIPILGRIFRSNSEQRNKNELLIFITPKILNQDKAFLKTETF